MKLDSKTIVGRLATRGAVVVALAVVGSGALVGPAAGDVGKNSSARDNEVKSEGRSTVEAAGGCAWSDIYHRKNEISGTGGYVCIWTPRITVESKLMVNHGPGWEILAEKDKLCFKTDNCITSFNAVKNAPGTQEYAVKTTVTTQKGGDVDWEVITA